MCGTGVPQLRISICDICDRKKFNTTDIIFIWFLVTFKMQDTAGSKNCYFALKNMNYISIVDKS